MICKFTVCVAFRFNFVSVLSDDFHSLREFCITDRS